MKAYHDKMARPAGARIAEALSFFEFMQSELPAMLQRRLARKAGFANAKRPTPLARSKRNLAAAVR